MRQFSFHKFITPVCPLLRRFCLLHFCWLLFLAPPVRAAGPCDTLVIKSSDEAADVYKGLFLLRTNKDLAPETVLALKTSEFSPLYPQKSFSERLTVSKYYWIKIVLKSELKNADLFYFQFNSQVLDLVRGYQKKDTGDLRFLGISGTDAPLGKESMEAMI